MREITDKFKALSDPNRIRILKMLQIRSMCVCELQAVLNLAASTVSKHLSILRNAGFIYDIKEQKWVNYYIDNNNNDPLIKSLLETIKNEIPNQGSIQNDGEKIKYINRDQLCTLSNGDTIELEK